MEYETHFVLFLFKSQKWPKRNRRLHFDSHKFAKARVP